MLELGAYKKLKDGGHNVEGISYPIWYREWAHQVLSFPGEPFLSFSFTAHLTISNPVVYYP